MTQHDRDRKFMEEAITWANVCQPKEPSTPKVGAIIAIGENPIGRGRRGTGDAGDDEHAEWNALAQVTDKSQLAQATLYTTLEPCTADVRKKPLESCSELLVQHRVKKVFVGMLDPNQGVTGKGLWRLQDAGIEVALFPHDLANAVRSQNAAFIRSQQTLGAKIVTPAPGEELPTYETGGKHTVRFKCNNPPSANTYLLIYHGGSYWPQAGPFRQVENGEWEIDAHFGTTGDHTLQIVTAGELAGALVRYYRKVVDQNRTRRENLRTNLRDKFDASLLGGDYPGIEMNGLLKGFQHEDSVNVKIAYYIDLLTVEAEPKIIARGRTLKIKYEIKCSEDVPTGIWLGASFTDKTGKLFHNTGEDKAVSVVRGTTIHGRDFTVAKDASVGEQMLATSLWRGIVGTPSKSKWTRGGLPIRITVID
jgi:pyrimidine deaminase RibD-like protein